MRRRSHALPAAAAAAAAAALATLGACDKRPPIDRERAAALFSEVTLDTEPGLSGLAADGTSALWTIAERAARAYRITLDAALRPTIETLAVEGMPPHTDLEGIAVLGKDRFALGTEGHDDGVATVLVADRRGTSLVVTGSFQLSEREVGIRFAANHGAEGVCGAGETIIVAIEGAGELSGRRWAPVVRIVGNAVVRSYRVWLTSATGKISGLDCQLSPDGTVTAWAVERHFEVSRLLRFTLPPLAPGAGPGFDEITPAIALDLDRILNGRLNLEGIAHLPDGRIVTVVDNQWRTITGPSQLLVFRPGAVP